MAWVGDPSHEENRAAGIVPKQEQERPVDGHLDRLGRVRIDATIFHDDRGGCGRLGSGFVHRDVCNVVDRGDLVRAVVHPRKVGLACKCGDHAQGRKRAREFGSGRDVKLRQSQRDERRAEPFGNGGDPVIAQASLELVEPTGVGQQDPHGQSGSGIGQTSHL